MNQHAEPFLKDLKELDDFTQSTSRVRTSPRICT